MMAERRMFAKTIIDSDAFLDMPATAQLLYFQLGVRADDDGFVNNPKRIMRDVRSSDDDMKMLVAKQYVIPFDSGVIVITHWHIHNYIRKDRYIPTTCTEEKKELNLGSDGIYKLSDIQSVDQRSTNGIPSGSIGKVRLGKDSIGKDNTLTGAPVEIEEHPEEVIALTNRFYQQMQKPTKYINKPPDLTKWYKPIHDLHRLDKIDYSLIEKVIDFATTDSFWKTVIQSTLKLRHKFNQLEIKMQAQGISHNNKPAFDYEKQREENERLFGGK